MRTALLYLALTLAAAAGPLAAQQRPVEWEPPRSWAGITLDVAQPVGEFGDHVDTGFGLHAHYRYGLDPASVLSLRLEGSYVHYGHESRRVLVSPTIGGRITADLDTDNSIVSVGFGPQLTLPRGPVRPYVNAVGGYTLFQTVSTLKDAFGESYLSDTNYDDGAWFYGGGAGVQIPVSSGRVPVLIDLGARYRSTDEITYLREGDILDLPGGRIALDLQRSEADLLTYQIGVVVGIRPDQDQRRERKRRR